MIQLKRAYDPFETDDGCRILVDRLWPRGISKEELQIDHWVKEIAPSKELRKWFDHDSAKFEEFNKRYLAELSGSSHPQIDKLRSLCQRKDIITLVYAAKDRKHNNAVVLRNYIKEQLTKGQE